MKEFAGLRKCALGPWETARPGRAKEGPLSRMQFPSESRMPSSPPHLGLIR